MAHALGSHGIDPVTPVARIGVEQLGDFAEHEDTVLVIGHWLYTGRGHSPGQAIYAATIAEDLAESRRLARQSLRLDRSEAA